MPPRTLRHLSTPPHNHRNWVYRTDHLLAAKVSWRVTTLGLQERSTNAPVEQWNGCAQFESPTVRALNSSRPVQASVQAIELGKAALNSSRPPSEQPRADLRQRASRAGQRASRAATKCNTEHPSAQLLGEFHMDRPRFRGSLVTLRNTR